MQLNSIIYDIPTLSSAISTQLNAESTSFQAIYPSDTATSLVNTLSSYGAMLQYQLVSAMANCYTDSAYSEAGIHQLAETLGNRLHGNISSQAKCNITRTNLQGIPNVTIPKGTKFSINGLNFFNKENLIFPLSFDTINDTTLIQGELLTAEFTTSGISGERIYFSENFKCNTDLIEVYINNVKWKTTESFLPYVITDNNMQDEMNIVILRTDPDGRSYIKFGNNSNGVIPPVNSTVVIKYISNEGATGNLPSINLEVKLVDPIYYTTDSGQREQLTITGATTTTAASGFDTQSIDTLRESSPYVFASGQRAVRRNDYKAMLLNNCGYLTCNVWGEYEEAIAFGGYDKIMMNMVYYTGIKSIQYYDAQPIGQFDDLSTSFIDEITVSQDSGIGFYNFSGNISSARGFNGSYIVNINSYTNKNIPIGIKYTDKYGTGILTYNSHENSTLSSADDLYPVNDFVEYDDKGNIQYKTTRYNITTNQDLDATYPPQNLITGGVNNIGYRSSGKTKGHTAVITFNNPFQIFVTAQPASTIAAFAFKSPESDIYSSHFIGQFAIYATNDESANTTNIKNDSAWTRIAEVQSFDFNVQPGGWSNWITTNLFKPGTTTSDEDDISNLIWTTPGTTPNLTINLPAKFKDDELTFDLTINDFPVSTSDYVVNVSDGILKILNRDILSPEYKDGEKIPDVIILKASRKDWELYTRYVIEVYSIANPNVNNPAVVAIDQMKIITKDSASTIWYANNNYVKLKVPVIKDKNGGNQICLPSDMQYYQYNVTVENISEYLSGDTLHYITPDNKYNFIVNIINPQQNQVSVYLDNNPTITTLRGKDPLLVSQASLSYTRPSANDDPNLPRTATISITSTNTVNISSSYTGNFYSNTDIQSVDMPVIDKYNHFTTYIEFKQPRIKNINIDVTIEYENVVTYQDVKNNVITAIMDIFKITPYYIGKTLNVSDIWKAINSVSGVKRFIVTTPINNIDCKPFELIVLPKENLIIHDVLNSEYK